MVLKFIYRQPLSSYRFKVKASRFLDITVKFADFLLGLCDQYIKWPPVEER